MAHFKLAPGHLFLSALPSHPLKHLHTLTHTPLHFLFWHWLRLLLTLACFHGNTDQIEFTLLKQRGFILNSLKCSVHPVIGKVHKFISSKKQSVVHKNNILKNRYCKIDIRCYAYIIYVCVTIQFTCCSISLQHISNSIFSPSWFQAALFANVFLFYRCVLFCVS